jgi:hypothetical protein
MARWWFTLLATTALAACSRVPERSRRSAAAPEVAAGNVAAAEPSRLASGELTDDPSPGGRKPAPPVAGAGRGLPLRAGEEPVAGAAVAGHDPGRFLR